MTQNNPSSWEASQMLVMDKLGQISGTLERQDKDVAGLRAEMARVREELAVYKTNSKWEIRIISSVWGLIIMGINAMLNRHGS